MKGNNKFKEKDVFISYRRDGGVFIARMISAELKRRGYKVFYDIDDIGPGAFDNSLLEKIENSRNFVLILSEGSLDRCIDSKDTGEDWVRIEIRHALKMGINIIPVLVDGYDFPEKLPEDIDSIRKFQAVYLNHLFIDAGIKKMERYFVKKPINKVLCAGAIILVLVIGILVGKMIGCNGEDSGGDKTSTNNTSNKGNVEAGYQIGTSTIDTSTVESYGNTSGNLCNEGYASYRGSTYGESTTLAFINKLADGSSFWYNRNSGEIIGKTAEGEKETLLVQDNVGYLLVTPEKFYYTVGDVLYCAAHTEDGKIGEAEKILSGICRENNLIVEENIVYYCKEGEGIFRYDIQQKTEEVLVNQETTWNFKLVGKRSDWLYVQDAETIWRLNIGTSEQEIVAEASEIFTDVQFTGANVCGSWVYFVVSDADADTVKRTDCVYRVHLDGTQIERIFTAESYDHNIQVINVFKNNEKEALFVSVWSEEELCVYTVDIESAAVVNIATSDFTGFSKEICIDSGNTIGNLCNGGVVANISDENYTYIGGPNDRYYNMYTKDFLVHYSIAKKEIVLTYKENEKLSSKMLLENVECSYLYANPEWIYYMIEEDGVSNLYRAENKLHDFAIGKPQLLASGVLKQNGVAIHNGYIYYWVKNEGLYRMKTDGRENALFYKQENKNYVNWATYDVTTDYLHFRNGNKLYRLSLERLKVSTLLNGDSYFPDSKIVSVVQQAGMTLLAVHYEDETKADEIWKFEEGKEAELLITMPLEERIEIVNIEGNTCYIWLKNNEKMVRAKFLINGTSELHYF